MKYCLQTSDPNLAQHCTIQAHLEQVLVCLRYEIVPGASIRKTGSAYEKGTKKGSAGLFGVVLAQKKEGRSVAPLVLVFTFETIGSD